MSTNRNQSHKAMKIQWRDSVSMCDVVDARQRDLWAFHPQSVLEPTWCSFYRVTRFDKHSWNHTCVWVLCSGWAGCPGGRDSKVTLPAMGSSGACWGTQQGYSISLCPNGRTGSSEEDRLQNAAAVGKEHQKLMSTSAPGALRSKIKLFGISLPPWRLSKTAKW